MVMKLENFHKNHSSFNYRENVFFVQAEMPFVVSCASVKDKEPLIQSRSRMKQFSRDFGGNFFSAYSLF